MNALDEFRHRRKFIIDLPWEETESRIIDFYSWIKSNAETVRIIDEIQSNIDIIESNELKKSPSSPEEIYAFAIYLLERIIGGTHIFELSYKFNIKSKYGSTKLQDSTDAVMESYIEPFFEYIENELEKLFKNEEQIFYQIPDYSNDYPKEIFDSLQKFHNDHPDINRNAFIMMQFRETKIHNKILEVIRNVLVKYGINALRADDKEYHEDLFPNVLTYIYGSKFGIAVFERLEAEEFNPNVSLEVGYLKAMKKPICLLKDKTLKTLQTDLVGKLYRTFDPQEPENTIPKELEKWLRDKDIIT